MGRDIELMREIWDYVHDSSLPIKSTREISGSLFRDTVEVTEALDDMVEGQNIRELFQWPPPDDEYRAWTTSKKS